MRISLVSEATLMQIIEEITAAIEKNKYTIGVFIDIKKAFDSINHNILISNSRQMG